MNRPLWQIFLVLLLLGLALQRGFFAWAVSAPGEAALVSVVAGACAALALATAIALWLGHTATVPLLVTLGIALAAAALIEAFAWGIRPPVSAISTVIVVALSTGALALALRGELRGEGGDERSSSGRRARGPS